MSVMWYHLTQLLLKQYPILIILVFGVALWLVWGYASSYFKGSEEERKVWRFRFSYALGFLVIGLALVFVIVLILTWFQ